MISRVVKIEKVDEDAEDHAFHAHAHAHAHAHERNKDLDQTPIFKISKKLKR